MIIKLKARYMFLAILLMSLENGSKYWSDGRLICGWNAWILNEDKPRRGARKRDILFKTITWV